MNNRALTLSLAIAAFAVYLIYDWVGGIEEKATRKFGSEVIVLKAKRDIKEAESLDSTMFVSEAIPKAFLEPSAIGFANKDDQEEIQKSIKALTGAVALVPIKKGEQIAYNKITEPGVKTGLAPQVAPGKRAFAIPVNEQSGVSKLLKPGDRVDLIAVIDLGGGKENKVAKTVIQDTVILAVGKYVTNNIARIVEREGDKEKVRPLGEFQDYATVTVEVDPQQAQMLALILANGENAMSLSLRNNDDTDRKADLGTSFYNDVLGLDTNRIQRVPSQQNQIKR
jgi:pilus assembly protein CpaB